jgi:hypothetical protein
MKKFKNLLVTAVILACVFTTSAFGADAKALIHGPKDAGLGNLVVLDASGSTGRQFKWKLLNSQLTYFEAEGGRKLIFASGEKGTYHFALVVADVDANDSVSVDIAIHVLVIGGDGPVVVIPDEPVVIPDDPTPVVRLPSTNFGIEKEIYSLLKDAKDRTSAGKMADVYTGVTASVAAGAIKTREDLELEVIDRNRDVLGQPGNPTHTAWLNAFYRPLQTMLNDMSRQGKLDTLDDYTKLYNDLAVVFRYYSDNG